MENINNLSETQKENYQDQDAKSKDQSKHGSVQRPTGHLPAFEVGVALATEPEGLKTAVRLQYAHRRPVGLCSYYLARWKCQIHFGGSLVKLTFLAEMGRNTRVVMLVKGENMRC